MNVKAPDSSSTVVVNSTNVKKRAPAGKEKAVLTFKKSQEKSVKSAKNSNVVSGSKGTNIDVYA